MTPNTTHAEQLLGAGFKLCRLKANTKQPVGNNWNKELVTHPSPHATGYGFPLAVNGRCSIDPDEVDLARTGMAALGFDLDQIMAAGVRTLSTRPQSGGRAMFADPGDLRWIRFVVKFPDWDNPAAKLRPVTALELRAKSENLQDCVPGLVYFNEKGDGPYTQTYANGRTFLDAMPLPDDFVAWWRRMSSDHDFMIEQQRKFGEACGGEAKLDWCDTGSVKKLAFPSPCRSGFDRDNAVEDILAAHGYLSTGHNRWSPPSSTSSPGVRPVPGKNNELWQSDHASDDLIGTFDAWSAFVVLEHGGSLSDAEAAAVAYRPANPMDLFDMEPDVTPSHLATPPTPLPPMPGVVEELARWIAGSAPQSIPGFAMAAALAVISALSAGRYVLQRTDTPMNLYLIMVAETGVGKDAYLRMPIDIIKQIPVDTGTEFAQGVTSGPALMRQLARKRSLMLSMDEIGHTLGAMGAKDNIHGASFMAELLSLYSGGAHVTPSRLYAQEKDNIPAVAAPHLQLLGATTPSKLWSVLKGFHVEEGLLNRVLLFQSTGAQDNARRNRTLPAHLKDALTRVAVPDFNESPGFQVGEAALMQWPIDEATHDAFLEMRRQYRSMGALWSRAAENSLRVAGLIALADQREVTVADLMAGEALVRHSMGNTAAEVKERSFESDHELLLKTVVDIVAKGKTESKWKKHTRPGRVPRAYVYSMTGRFGKKAVDAAIEMAVASAVMTIELGPKKNEFLVLLA